MVPLRHNAGRGFAHEMRGIHRADHRATLDILALAGLVALAAVSMATHARADAGSDEIPDRESDLVMEVCVETQMFTGVFGHRECFLISGQEYAAMSFGEYPAEDRDLAGAQALHLSPSETLIASTMTARRANYVEENWKRELPDAAQWMVAFKAPGDFRGRIEAKNLFLGDNLRHGRPSNGIGALMPYTARNGLPFESVGLRLQIAY